MRASIVWQAALSLAVFASATIAAAAEPIELTEDFSSYPEGSDGSPKWARYLGRWAMRGGQCEQTDAGAKRAYLFLPEPMLADLRLTLEQALEGFSPRKADEDARSRATPVRLSITPPAWQTNWVGQSGADA